MENKITSNNIRFIIKGFVVLAIIICLLIPKLLLENLVKEREERQKQVSNEINSKWASAQTIYGAFLAVPNIHSDSAVSYYSYILPDDLNIQCEVIPEIRYRSIFKIAEYIATVKMNVSFNTTLIQKLKNKNFQLNKSLLCLGLSDLRGLEDKISITAKDDTTEFFATLPQNGFSPSGLHAIVDISTPETKSYTIQFKLKGSEKLYFTSSGKRTQVQLQSTWNSPKFDGSILPYEKTFTPEGFNAKWKNLLYAQQINQTGDDIKKMPTHESFGVDLIQVSDSYSKTMRTTKYSILVIVLTFGMFFFVELLKKYSMHELHYTLIGFALTMFYTLLLSISEYTGFNIAYLIAGTATVLLISLFVASMFKNKKMFWLPFTSLFILYLFIFILIQLEDYALLFGSIGLFVLLAILMFYARKIQDANKEKI